MGFVLNIISIVVGIVAVVVAMYSIRSSSKDAKKQIAAIKDLCVCQIDDTIASLETECSRIDGIIEEYKSKKTIAEQDTQKSQLSLNMHNRYNDSPYENIINNSIQTKKRLQDRISSLKKRREMFLNR